MDDAKLKEYINNEVENEFIDFKIIQYDWSNTECKGDFLVDVICMANSSVTGDKYIITGVKIKNDGERIIRGINPNTAVDSAEYQQLVTENIEPSVSVEFKILDYDGKKFGIFRIYACNDKPYLLKKKYGKYESGYIKVRKGSRNTNISRYILDCIYKSKEPKEKSSFKISGIVDGKVSDNLILNSYDFFPDINGNINEAIDLLKKINGFKIDDIEIVNNVEKEKPLLFLKEGIFKSTPIEIKEDIIDNIKYFADVVEEELNDNFFNIGNAGKRINNISGSSFGPYIDYINTGSVKSIEKYEMILELNNRINKLVGWTSFLEKVKDIKFLQLAITEIGNISDQEIEVNIELPKNCYIDVDEFPQASKYIVEEIAEKYSQKMFMPKYDDSISEFREMPRPPVSHVPSPLLNPFLTSTTDTIDTIYDYIDYGVINKEDKTILSLTIKNLKVNETMVFPGNILLKNKINKIKYTIFSKNTKEKIIGVIEVKN